MGGGAGLIGGGRRGGAAAAAGRDDGRGGPVAPPGALPAGALPAGALPAGILSTGGDRTGGPPTGTGCARPFERRRRAGSTTNHSPAMTLATLTITILPTGRPPSAGGPSTATTAGGMFSAGRGLGRAHSPSCPRLVPSGQRAGIRAHAPEAVRTRPAGQRAVTGSQSPAAVRLVPAGQVNTASTHVPPFVQTVRSGQADPAHSSPSSAVPAGQRAVRPAVHRPPALEGLPSGQDQDADTAQRSGGSTVPRTQDGVASPTMHDVVPAGASRPAQRTWTGMTHRPRSSTSTWSWPSGQPSVGRVTQRSEESGRTPSGQLAVALVTQPAEVGGAPVPGQVALAA